MMFHIKYEKFLLYVARALGLAKWQYRIYHNHSIDGLGEVILHSENLFIKIGSTFIRHFDELTHQLCYRWCKNIQDQSGGKNHWMPARMLHNPEKVIEEFSKVINMKKEECKE